MEFTKYDMFAYQILDYLVKKHHYQVIRVQQHKDDIWIMNAKQEQYPVIRISSRVHEDDGSEHEYVRNVHRVILNLLQREGPIITLSTNPDIVPIEGIEMKQILVTPTLISDEQILSIFHDLKNVVHESDQMDTEIANLTKEIEEVEHARHDTIMDKVEQKVIPKVTYAMIAMMLVLSLLAFGMSIMSEDTLVPYVALGAYYKMNIVAAYEYWRFLTAGFLAPDILSLFIYVFMFYHVGRICEPVFSRKQYASIVLISIIIGNIFTWVGDGNGVSMGIGAGIYGVIAAYTTHLICNRVIKHPLIIFALGKLICLSFIMWFIPGISLLNFMGGMCSGIMLSILFYKSKEVRLLKRNTLLSAIILLVSLVCFGIMQAPMTYDKTFDQQIIRFYQDTPWNMYARYLEKCYNKQYRWE